MLLYMASYLKSLFILTLPYLANRDSAINVHQSINMCNVSAVAGKDTFKNCLTTVAQQFGCFEGETLQEVMAFFTENVEAYIIHQSDQEYIQKINEIKQYGISKLFEFVSGIWTPLLIYRLTSAFGIIFIGGTLTF